MIEPEVIEPEVQAEEPEANPGNPKLKKLHEVLVKQGFAVPMDYDKFERAVSNPEKSKAFHEVLVKQGFAVPTDYEKFSSALGLGEVKKKDQTAVVGGEPSTTTGLPPSPSEPPNETQKKIEEALRQNQEAIQANQVPQEVVPAPSQDATKVIHQAFVPKPVLEKNAKDAQLKQYLEDEYKRSIDNGIPGYEHFAGQFNKAVVDALASIPKTVAILGKKIDDKLGLNNGAGDKANVENYVTYKAGQWLQDTAKELGFTNENPAMAQDFWKTAVPQGLGSVAAIAMTGITNEAGTAGLQMLGRESYLTATKQMLNVLKQPGLVVGGTMMGVPEFEQAKKAGQDDDTAFKVFLQNYVIGMTDAIPIGRAFDRINKLTDHSLVKVLKNGFQGGAEEFLQEGVQNYLTNLTASEYYDKSRDLFQGMASDAGAGFVVGFLLSAIGAGAAHLPIEDRKKVDAFIAEKEKEYHQAFGGAITDDHISKPESNIVAPVIPEPIEEEQPKPESNAVRIESPAEVHVRQASGDSEAVGQGEPQPEPESVTGTQGGQTEAPEPQVNHETGTPQRENKASQISVHAQPVEDISVDHQRFQNRDEAYSKKSVDKIVNAVVEGKFDVNEFDPIRTWRDPANGKTYVLSGHSRTEAFRRLQKMLENNELPAAAMEKLKSQGIQDFKHIPAIDVSNKTEAEARKFAEASNTLATQESDLERAKLIKKKRAEGQSLVSIRKEVGATRGQELLSNLKQNGKAWDAIKAVENSETVENKRRVYQVGEFIGEARHLFPHLTDSHENEMYDYLTEGKGKNIKTRQEFVERMDNVVNHIDFLGDNSQPLNLENRVSRGSNESEALQELNDLKKRRGELEVERDDKKKIPPASRMDEISREIGRINKDIVKATENISKAKAGDRLQTDLFGSPAEKTESKEQPGEEVPINKEGKQKVFVYGTLRDEATRTEALGEKVKSVPGVAPNEKKIDIQTFPEIEHEEGRNLRGDVIEVTPEQIKKLDSWEEKYERDVITLDNGDKAYVYKLNPGQVPEGNESGTTTDLEQNRTRKQPKEPVGEKNVPEDTGTSGQRTRNRKPVSTEAGLGPESNPSLSDLIPPTDGKSGDTGVDKQEPEPGVEQRPGRGADDTGGGPTNELGIEAKPNTAKQPARSTHAEGTSGLNVDRKLEQQRAAEGTGVVIKDLDNIKATLPMLLPHQIENVMKAETRFYNPPKEGEPNKGILFTDGTGTGKFLQVDEPVLSENGWVKIGNIKLGDRVYGIDGKLHNVVGVYPQGVMPLYDVIFSDGAKSLAGLEHQWAVQSENDRSRKNLFRVLTTADLIKTLQYQWAIPTVSPIQYEKKQLLIPPYILGVLIADGNLKIGTPRFTPGDEVVPEEVKKHLPKGYKLTVGADYGTSTSYGIIYTEGRENPFNRYIKSINLNVTGEFKFIPKEYLYSDVESRHQLLAGLIDCDGCIKEARVRYGTTSLRLAEDIKELALSLGYIATFAKYISGRPNELPMYQMVISNVDFKRLGVKKSNGRQARVKRRREIKEIVFNRYDEAVCISVDAPDSLYITRDYIVTHNTYTGLGIAKRFVKQGKKNVLIVVPTETKAEDWRGDGENLLLNIQRLPDTKSNGGEGTQVVTTYANFRANEVLGRRKFDLVIYDESHKLVSNQAGDQTEADKQHKEITNSPSVAQRKATEKFQSLVDKDYKELGRLSDKTKQYISDEKQKLLDQTKVVFLSATPFSYHQNLKYGDGYLFTMREGVETKGSRSYNQPSSEQQFYVQNFGYRMRYNKLTVPESGVDVSLMERMFHSGLVKKGAVSSKKLQLDKDYSREFVLIDDKLGLAIDEGVKLASDTDKYNFLPDVMRKKFNWLYQNQLLEAIKAKNIVDRIKKHMAMGRKVVVFHSYVNSLPSHPFDLTDPGLLPSDEKQQRAAEKEIRDFHAENPDLQKLDLRGLINPVKTLQNAFGDDVLVFNGTVPAKLRKKAIHDFNIDEGGKDILVVQMESGKEGISLHDVTGNHQRVEINLALPYKPTDAIQSEGRVYRIGQMSDAIIEYAVLHLDFEKLAFANKINERVKTAENLAFGEEARNLEDAFKEGYKDANLTAPSDEQGKGGKESDNTYETIDDYERAKSFYYARQKRTSKNKALEGTDYFATPEPLGFKMVQWLKSMPGEHLLEPSAGHGAIARFFPGNTENKFIEQSQELRPDLAINTVGELLPIRDFEDLHAVNKFHGIAMNPPFGTAGKTAWEHVAKALDHLKDGGRVVAIVPQGPSMEKRINAWLESDESKNYVVRAVVDLPSITFARAGTGVNTQILIIDKVNNEEQRQSLEPQKKIDLTRIEKVESLFDRIKEMEMPARVEPKEDAAMQVMRQLTQSRSAIIDIVKTGEKQDYEFIKGKHTKYGTDIYTVKLNKRLDASEYAAANRRAKALDGYYSSYKGNGAVPGFIFKTEERARQLLQFLGGDENPETSDQPENYLAMNADPSKGTTPMSAFETRVFNQDGDPFKLYEAVIDIVAKYNPEARLGQNNLKSGTTGTFYMPSRSLRVRGLNSVAVAFHELVHALDYQNQVITNFIKTTKQGSPLRKQLGDVFMRYYPKAHPNTDFRKKMIEGYATFIEKYIEKPTEINQRYPDLVVAFLKPGGVHYFNTMSDFLTDAEKIVTAYQRLNPLDKIGARVVSDRMEDLTPKYLTNTDKFTKELFDALSPIEKLAEQDGTHMTQGDVSLWMRLSNNAMQLAQKNISSHRGEFWSMNDKGEWNKSHDFNFNTLIKSLDKRGVTTDFAHYLVARRVDAEWLERNNIETQLQNPKLDPNDRMELDDQFQRLEAILKNDGISEIEAQEATQAGSQVFAQDEKMFDAMVQEGLDMAHNPLVQLLDDEGYEKMMSKEGYAPFKRQQYDELVGDTEVPQLTNTAGKTKVGAFMARRGSTKPIINPLISAMANHAEILRKSMKQMVYNKFLDVVKMHPDVFLEVPLTINPDSQNRFPQEKNPDIIMARRNQKRVPVLVSKEIKQVIDENYQYHNMHVLEQVGTSMSQLFRTGTTGIFWQFFINNSFLDQMAATTNTRNGMMPFVSSIRHATPALLNVASEKLFGKAMWFPHSKEAAYLKEYLFLAGSSQTFLSADITSQKSMEDKVYGEPKTWGKRVADYFSAVINLLSVPGNVTEIATRFTEYYLARRQGKSQVVALEEAGRVSTPFHHSGRLGGPVGKSFVRSVPYFNASLQVLRQTKRTLNTAEGRKRYAFTALSMLAASAGSMLYILGKDDDDEQKKILRTLAPDDLSKYLYFPNPYSSKRLIKVRIPEQLGWLCALQNMALIQGSQQTDYRWSEWGEAGGSFLPTQLNPFNPTQMLFSYVPPAVKIPVESMVGIKTYPNIRPIENEHDKRLPPELRYNKYTSPVARELGELLGWSPKKIDHFVEGIFGRSIKYVTGKGGTYGVQQIFEKELYFEASRQIQFYYNVKERNERQVKAYEDGLKNYSDREVDRMLEIEGLLGDIDNGLQDFKEIDADQNPMEATGVRNHVFDLIRELEKLEE